MAGNTFGQIFKITTYGESHGKGIGVVIDGCPAGLDLDSGFIQGELNRRRPGQSDLVSPRKEEDIVEIYSGVHEGKTTGSPLHLFVANKDARPGDYSHLKQTFRPSHADYTYHIKYGFRDARGGGRSSARETIARVAAGAVAKLLLRHLDIRVLAFVRQVGPVMIPDDYVLQAENIEKNAVRCPHLPTALAMVDYIRLLKDQGDSTGGVIQCEIVNCPAGLGEPVFDKLHADLGKAMLSINAVKGFEIGSGFAGAAMTGSKHNDIFTRDGDTMKTITNHSGGIQGGISNGMPIVFRVAFKPVSTIMSDQVSVNAAGEPVILEGKGRHDPCVLPRAVPIVEAMAALVLADHFLRTKTSKL